MYATSCTPVDPLVDTETGFHASWDSAPGCCTPFDPLVDTETRMMLRSSGVNCKGCTPFDPLVDTETFQEESDEHQKQTGCTPFDPLVDTETSETLKYISESLLVAPPSIRLWILKHFQLYAPSPKKESCTPFDPLVDTETHQSKHIHFKNSLLHPLRSACGY